MPERFTLDCGHVGNSTPIWRVLDNGTPCAFAPTKRGAEQMLASLRAVAAKNDAAELVAKHRKDGDLVYSALKSMRPAPGDAGKRNHPMWAAVMWHFGAGSTLAQALCRRFGFDPDSVYRRQKGWVKPRKRAADLVLYHDEPQTIGGSNGRNA